MGWSSSLHGNLARARRLTVREWLLVARLRLWLTVEWAGLRIAGLERTERFLAGPGEVRRGRRDPLGRDELRRLSSLLDMAARAGFLRHTCLPRSLTLLRLLRKRGTPAVLRIGVRRQGEGVAGHAWVEVAGEVVGEPEGIAERFLPLVADAGPPGTFGTGGLPS